MPLFGQIIRQHRLYSSKKIKSQNTLYQVQSAIPSNMVEESRRTTQLSGKNSFWRHSYKMIYVDSCTFCIWK